MQLEGRRAALLMIDMQNGFIDPAGSVARIGFPVQLLSAAVAPCERLLAAARAAGLPVAHTRYVYEPGLTDGGVMVEHMLPELRQESALVAGTWDAETIPQLAALPGEAVFDKNRPSALLNTELEAWLRAHGVTQVIVSGVTTSCCVETSVRDLSQRDFEVFIAADAVAEYDEERHRVALKTLGLLFARVLEVGVIAETLAGEAGDAQA
jgi:ureidoacrylate peracid hydrolase